MKRAILMLTLGLGLATTACAEHRPAPGYRVSPILQIAGDLERATAEVHRLAQRERLRGRERHVLAALRDLERDARRFRREVAERPRRPIVAADEYRDLERSWRRAARSLRRLRGCAAVYRAFDRVDALMGALDRYYDRRDGRDGGWGDGRHDRDGYGHGRHDHDGR